MSPFGENLRKIRNSRGMSQEEFADLLGTSKQVISRYETAQRSPKVSTVAEYAGKLGVSISELTGDPYTPDISEIEFALSGEIHDLTESEMQDVLDYVRFKRAQRSQQEKKS